ncbi:transglycosylase SLT domain-containing protein [Petrimonas sp.]|uniref:lytic transglycosylase domain-containing protein n=1 Tax=Petrimonas sp. TaxID=2023866 RepID=UPI003F51207D
MKKILLTLFSFALAVSWAVYAQESPQQNKNIEDNSIVPPESLNEHLATLLHEWQIDFSKSDNKCRQGMNVMFHDSVYTKRLYEMPTEMEMSYNHVVRQYIDMYANRRRDMVGYMLTIGKYYFPMFEEALDKHGLPLELKYLPVIESALNPIAVSRVGATGLWQFMLRTGQGYGLQVNSLVDERRDPHKSTEAAVRYLKDLYAIYGDWNLVIAAYNCGPGNVNKAIARSGGKRDYWQIYYNLPRETRGYVPAFIAANYIMNFYERHNICPIESYQEMVALDTVHVNNQVHFNQISEVLNIPLSDIRRWNPQFKKDVVPDNSQNYALILPTNKVYAFLEQKDEIANFRRNDFMTHRENTDQYLVSSGSSSVSGTNVYYKVRKGDNLGRIASKHRVTVKQLQAWNNLKTTRISVGKNLIVGKRAVAQPVQQQTETLVAQQTANTSTETVTKTVNEYYRVRSGDNLGKIAQRNRVTVAQLRSWNGLKSDNISVGKNLVVRKKTVEVEQPKPVQQTAETAAQPREGSSIITNYLKEQLEGIDTGSVEVPEIETSTEDE